MFFSDDDAEEDFSVNCTDFDELLDDNKPELIVISSDDSDVISESVQPTKSLSGVTLLVREGVKKKKSCNIVTTYVGGKTGNYTKFINFLHGPNSSKSAKKFFLLGG